MFMIKTTSYKLKYFFGLTTLLFLPVFVFAQSTSDSTKTFTLSNPLKVDSVAGLVQSFVEIFSYVVIIIAVLALIWVGFQYIVSRGDVTKMKDLKNWLWWIVVGVAVVIGARVIIEVVINTLSLSGTVDPKTINSVRSAIGK
ncbi:MAG: hypothetical protein A3C79_01655 [Candidatus Taylorbacteria bacterium RIFCSPHIGHO2_02_FULL_45_28]|uniref:Uncharacterized protein n=1 Tax=Candidatus Taylorbacteria bacterium RIFCSPHIGHO2_12_FULL_45_16 TaxID=1802315 RepID=A0A1G2N0S5_9BACT|nr:MAG: hypothetical protein A2830_03810 [Candidatus Taylorbacteria bacterium RIFCSPHIGHO2_01_FULL_44_110]OHA25140.1 MAG: hypothetical protein A3C79_01655 [Candidatus Taylorbacteria bacterium RIFCSPHIGHO2_02_FULL_45_28]OHA29019.1 MAG: hypothetical protein A3F51_02030 [Candidatus Taylorbacteria bacterium RIFCSPHIGHO2_12_FULL_45_16]OHA33138.1 MAG: hypothetical protein A3A23_03715 [Candidatus Taylorbacteria bacterium RIFCSPLOWO2_01_FULL_45_59]OHA39561.1 MAG: hypothetical protein A3I98_00295 [Candi